MLERITKKDRIKIFLRCFSVQGSWNFKSLLGLGFCYCSIPIAKRLFKSQKKQSEFLHRHLDFFNAHPYFASWCLGAVAKLEEEAILKKWPDKRPISIFKERLIGPLGSIGDYLFWSGIKPLSVAIGVCLAFAINWLALPVFFIIYNIPHIAIRKKGLELGYKKGFDLVSDVSMRHFKKYFKVISILGIVIIGILVMAAADWTLDQHQSVFVSFIITAILSIFFLSMKRSIHFIFMVTVVTSMIIGFIFYI